MVRTQCTLFVRSTDAKIVRMRAVGLLAVLLAACGGSNGGTGTQIDAPGNVDPMTRFNPWEAGAVWSYQISQAGKPTVTGKTRTIVGLEDVGAPHAGTMAYKVHVQLYSETKDLWEVPMGDLDVSYKVAFYNTSNVLYETDTEDPYRLKLDESAAHTATGAAWSETFSETAIIPNTAPSTKSETLNWSVVSAAEPITVVAGSYTALHIRRTNLAKNPVEVIDYWYAKGVGRLKETGGGTTEELESFTPGP